VHANACQPANSGEAANSRAAHFAILLIGGYCQRCGCAADAACFWLPPGHEQRMHTGVQAPWEVVHAAVVLHEVCWIDPTTRRILAEGLPTLRPVTQPGARRQAVWLNHCEHCMAPVTGLDDADARATVGLLLTAEIPPPVVLVTSRRPIALRAMGFTYGDLAEAALASVPAQVAPAGARERLR
jgi:hypothetical protein